MTPRTRRTITIALLICTALPAWGQQYLLYTPQPVTTGHEASLPAGILVQEIEIRKGDTLYDLSRKFSGRGMYYPQILLFNSIKNPNLIYAGRTLKIPLSQKEEHASNRMPVSAHKPAVSKDINHSVTTEEQSPVGQAKDPSPVSSPGTELSSGELKAGGTKNIRSTRLKKRTAVTAKKRQPAGTGAPTQLPAAHKTVEAPSSAADSAAGQKLFESAVKSYRQDDCRAALELLDRYLADNPGSPLAADANLYKADCYLKLSAQ